MGDRYRVYVLDLSYFSGKLEAYLRYKQILFERLRALRRPWNPAPTSRGPAPRAH